MLAMQSQMTGLLAQQQQLQQAAFNGQPAPPQQTQDLNTQISQLSQRLNQYVLACARFSSPAFLMAHVLVRGALRGRCVVFRLLQVVQHMQK